ncbi:MAG: flagellar hook capping FlgD N-terminal domain-containing protein [Georgenia sp.]
MSVPPVSGGYYAPQTAQTTAVDNSVLDKDAFLQLLVASLKYQDPSAPMDTSELMAQTTQLATMEQLAAITSLSQEAFALQQRGSATALVGRYVEYVDNDGEKVSGLVESVDLSTAVPTVRVGDQAVPLNLVNGVAAAPATGAAPAGKESDVVDGVTEPDPATEPTSEAKEGTARA